MYTLEVANVHFCVRLSAFIGQVFMESVAPKYSREGVSTFLKYVTPRQIKKRMKTEDDFFIIARDGERIIGMIEMREWNHITLLFVDKDMRQAGVGKALIEAAVGVIKNRGREVSELNVNAVPGAESAYEAMGFLAFGAKTEKIGIIYTPMQKILVY